MSRAVVLAAGLAALASLAALGARPGAAEPPPSLSVRLAAPRGGMTSERVVAVSGAVEGFRGDRMTLVLNGIPLSVPVRDGRFEQPQVFSPGLNTIRAVVEQDGAVAEDVVAVYASVPAKDLRITMTWDTPGTDVDLWVTPPEDERVFYGRREGKAGGTLDTDVTTGFGPETFTQARTTSGALRVQAHAYRIDRPTRIEVTVVRNEGTPDEERRVLRALLLRTGDVVDL